MRHLRLAPAMALVGLVLAGCDSQTETEADTQAQPQQSQTQTPPQPGSEFTTPAEKASYGIGLNMGRSLAQEGLEDLSSKAVAQGIEDAINQREQKLSDEELMEAFSALQARAEERQAERSEAARKAGQEFLAENAKREGVVTTESGLQYEVIEPAEGKQPGPDDVVTVHYEGRLPDGTVFDSSIQRGSPIDLPVSGVIPGWVEGLQLMHVGEKVKLYIPSELAYGEQSPSPAIPANSVLVFDLELLDIKDQAASETSPEELQSSEAQGTEAPAAEAPAAQ